VSVLSTDKKTVKDARKKLPDTTKVQKQAKKGYDSFIKALPNEKAVRKHLKAFKKNVPTQKQLSALNKKLAKKVAKKKSPSKAPSILGGLALIGIVVGLVYFVVKMSPDKDLWAADENENEDSFDSEPKE
jgi:hypothetical protein